MHLWHVESGERSVLIRCASRSGAKIHFAQLFGRGRCQIKARPATEDDMGGEIHEAEFSTEPGAIGILDLRGAAAGR